MAGDLTLRITVTEIETLQKPWFCPGESPVLCSGWSPATGLPDPLARRPLPGRRRSGGNHDLGFFCHISRSCRPGYENRSPVSGARSRFDTGPPRAGSPWHRRNRGYALAKEPLFPHPRSGERSEEHTSELQSRLHLVCRLLLEKKN